LPLKQFAQTGSSECLSDFDFFRDGLGTEEILFVSMELLHGQTLSDYLRESVNDSRWIVVKVLYNTLVVQYGLQLTR
jgi:hypothetical protein